MELISLGALLLIAAAIAMLLPTATVLAVIFIYCGYFGLIERDAFGVYTPENLLSLISFALIPSLIQQKLILRQALTDVEKLPILMILLFAWGVFWPTIRGYSSFFLSVTEGKQLLTYLFVLYCIAARKRVNHSTIKLAIILSGAILACEQIVYSLSGIHPPGFSLIDPNNNLINEGNIHIMYPHMMSAALLLIIGETLYARTFSLAFILAPILVFGIALQAHLSISLSTLTAVLMSTLWPHVIHRRFFALIISTLLLSISLFIIVNFETESIQALWSIQFESIQSLVSRGLISAQRISYFFDSPLMGYGFVHQDSAMGIVFGSSALGLHDLRLASVDNGYLDLLLKFGLVGSIIVLSSYLKFLICLSSTASTSMQPLLILCALFLGVMLTWSMLTYVHGIIFLGIIVLLIKGSRHA